MNTRYRNDKIESLSKITSVFFAYQVTSIVMTNQFQNISEFVRHHTSGLKPLRSGASTHVMHRCMGVANEFEASVDKTCLFISSYTKDLNALILHNNIETNQVAIYERIGNTYPFFIEIELPAGYDVKHLVTSLNNILNMFIESDDKSSTNTIVIATSNETNGFFCARFTWKYFIVTTHEALTMRERIVGELPANDQEANIDESFRWHELINFNCYTNPDGLVLPGCKSYQTCKTCNGKKSIQTCSECWGSGICQNIHTLLPNMKLVDTGENIEITKLRKEDGTFLPEHISEFSLSNINAPKVSWIRPFGTPYYHMEQKARSAPVVYPNTLLDYYSNTTKGRKVCITGVPFPIAMLLRRAIQRAYPRFHSKIDVKAEYISQDKKKKIYYVPVFGIGSNTCVKYDGEHDDSRVYFTVRPDGIEQCCHSRDSVQSVTGPCECKTKKCGIAKMNSNMRASLFPNETRKSPSSSISSSTYYQIACRASDIAWENINTNKRKRSIIEYII